MAIVDTLSLAATLSTIVWLNFIDVRKRIPIFGQRHLLKFVMTVGYYFDPRGAEIWRKEGIFNGSEIELILRRQFEMQIECFVIGIAALFVTESIVEIVMRQ